MARLQAGDTGGAKKDELEAIEIFRREGDRVGEAIGLSILGQIALHEADHEAARTHLNAGLALARELEHPEQEGECELLLGEVDLETGNLKEASEHFARSHSVCTEGTDKRGEANAIWRLGEVDLALGNHGAARSRLPRGAQALPLCGDVEGAAGLSG